MIANLMVRYSESMAIEIDTAHIYLNMTPVIIQGPSIRGWEDILRWHYSVASNRHSCGGYSFSLCMGHGCFTIGVSTGLELGTLVL